MYNRVIILEWVHNVSCTPINNYISSGNVYYIYVHNSTVFVPICYYLLDYKYICTPHIVLQWNHLVMGLFILDVLYEYMFWIVFHEMILNRVYEHFLIKINFHHAMW